MRTDTVLGDTTGGGTGNPVTRTLPNGWTYQVSRWIGYDAERVAFEDRGIAPDVAVQGSAEQTGSEDLIIDAAIARLRNGGAG